MGDLLKFIFFAFLIILILCFAIPLLWLVIKLIVWCFGGLFAGIGASVGLVIFVIACLIFIIWCLAS